MPPNTAPFDVTGHPATSLPCGMSDGLPVGLGREVARGRHLPRRRRLSSRPATGAACSSPEERRAPVEQDRSLPYTCREDANEARQVTTEILRIEGAPPPGPRTSRLRQDQCSPLPLPAFVEAGAGREIPPGHLHESRDDHFEIGFQTITLETNYLSARNIVRHSQKLIQYNKRRVPKTIRAAPGAGKAKIEIVRAGPIGERLRLVSEIARDIREPDRVAVIGRVRSRLIPYEVYYASDGGPVKTATDLDVFASDAFARSSCPIPIEPGRIEPGKARSDRTRRTLRPAPCGAGKHGKHGAEPSRADIDFDSRG